ncbi:MAG TPA: rhomboid family intramembrane serine protease, partial [Flavobacterium sp.]|nr:rhomboid family intramembrane serine protease [Flavobacterium sp.]
HSPLSDKFQFWQPVTHMFMHGGIMHIFFNMFALMSFGSLLERMWGPKKFLFFYFSCGLGAAALHLGANYFEIQSILHKVEFLELSDATIRQIINVPFRDGYTVDTQSFTENVLAILQGAGKTIDGPELQVLFDAAVINQIPAVGASGAIYGVMVAFAFLFPNGELMMMFIPIPIKAKYFVPILVGVDIYLGITGKSLFGSGGGVAHFAHVGGALIGFIMMWYWKKNQFNSNRWN